MSTSTLRATAAAVGKLRLPSTAKRTFASSENLVKTELYDLHKELGGDMVPFAGYELPVLFKGENGGVMKEHMWCRAEGKAAMFDVSHMGQVCTTVAYCSHASMLLYGS
jgi:aminomethyltransferase